MRVTQKEIAKQLGLSPTSVSLVLGGKPNKISLQSRERILQLAAQVHYRSREHPVPMKHDKNCIGLIIPPLSNYFFAGIVQGVSEYAQSKNHRLLLFTSDGELGSDQKGIQIMKASGVGALLITASEDCSEEVFSELDCPIVQVDRQSPTLQYSSVVLNNKKGGFLATQHLLTLGHRKIAYLPGPMQLISARERLDGFFWAFEERGLRRPENCVFAGDYLSESGYRAADQIIKEGYTAVACGNDLMAYGVIKRCGEIGVEIPQDLSIVGFDDLAFSELIHPALTTVSQSGYAIGYRACQIAFQEIQDPSAHRQTVLLEPSLIVRKSTASLEGNK